jgi:hypothetical protein
LIIGAPTAVTHVFGRQGPTITAQNNDYESAQVAINPHINNWHTVRQAIQALHERPTGPGGEGEGPYGPWTGEVNANYQSIRNLGWTNMRHDSTSPLASFRNNVQGEMQWLNAQDTETIAVTQGGQFRCRSLLLDGTLIDKDAMAPDIYTWGQHVNADDHGLTRTLLVGFGPNGVDNYIWYDHANNRLEFGSSPTGHLVNIGGQWLIDQSQWNMRLQHNGVLQIRGVAFANGVQLGGGGSNGGGGHDYTWLQDNNADHHNLFNLDWLSFRRTPGGAGISLRSDPDSGSLYVINGSNVSVGHFTPDGYLDIATGYRVNGQPFTPGGDSGAGITWPLNAGNSNIFNLNWLAVGATRPAAIAGASAQGMLTVNISDANQSVSHFYNASGPAIAVLQTGGGAQGAGFFIVPNSPHRWWVTATGSGHNAASSFYIYQDAVATHLGYRFFANSEGCCTIGKIASTHPAGPLSDTNSMAGQTKYGLDIWGPVNIRGQLYHNGDPVNLSPLSIMELTERVEVLEKEVKIKNKR